MRKKQIVVAFNCLIILLASAFFAFGQEKAVALKDKRITLQLEKQPLGVVFRYLTNIYDVPIGLEQSTLDRDHNDYFFETNLVDISRFTTRDKYTKEIIPMTFWRIKIQKHWFTINAANAPLEDVMNQIVEQMENYEWKIVDEVVNIYPVKGRDERFEKLLEVNIENFTIKKKFVVGEFKSRINYLSDLYPFLQKNNLHISGWSASNNYADINRIMDLEGDLKFENLTLKELLNKVTKIKRGGWMLRRMELTPTDPEKEVLKIDI